MKQLFSHGPRQIYCGPHFPGTLIDMTNDPYVTNRGRMTHHDLISRNLQMIGRASFHENVWGPRHVAAWKEPQHAEAGIVGLITAAATYADNYRRQFESQLGDDAVLGEPWADILRGVLQLLNGDLGRLDGGTVDKLVRQMLSAEGFETDG